MISICREWLASLPNTKGIIQDSQKENSEVIAKIIENKKEIEEWRLTDQNKLLDLFKVPLAINTEQSIVESIDNVKYFGNRLIIDPLDTNPKNQKLPEGIEHISNKELINYTDRNSIIFANENDLASAINKVCTQSIMAIKITKRNKGPLELVIPAIPNCFTGSRLLIVVDKDVNFELLQVVLGSESSVQSHSVEVHINDNATLNHGIIGLGNNEASFIGQTKVTQNPGSEYSLTTVQNGWLLGRIEPRVIQINGQANTSIKGLQISKDKQQSSLHSSVRFDGPEGSLNQINKIACLDKSHCIFNGAIKVPQSAQKTNASQLSRNLILSKGARIDTKPELQIVADDVQCSHGATVSQLQDNEVFYLQSRGINLRQATNMILKGFCQEIINDLPCEARRWQIPDKIINEIQK